MSKRWLVRASLALLLLTPQFGLERPGVTFKIFQFPADKIPRIDGNADDWAMVPDSYAIGMDQLMDTEHGHGMNHDPKNLDVKVKVGWVKGLNRLYFLYEAYDNYWDFSRTRPAQRHLRSGGGWRPLRRAADRYLPPRCLDARSGRAGAILIDPRISQADAHWASHGVHAQNYHIFTPPGDKDWAMAWGCAQYIKRLPYANAAYNYNFKPGESGKLVLEFWITPFDYAPCDGPQRAVESRAHGEQADRPVLGVLDYDDVNARDRDGLLESLAQADHVRQRQRSGGLPADAAGTAVPEAIEAKWSYKVVDMDRRLVAFQDESEGKVTSWKWDFGDGATSSEQNPMHQYKAGRDYTTILEVEGPAGKSRLANVWGVSVK